MKKIFGFFRKKLRANENGNHDQRRLIIILLIAGLILTLIQLYIVTDYYYGRIALFSFLGLLLVSLFLAYRNSLFLSRVVVPIAGFGVITLFVSGNGIHDEAMGGYYLVLIFAGLLLGNTGLIFFGILNTVAIISIGFAEYNGWISTRFGNLIDVPTIATSVMFMLSTTLVFYYMILRLNHEAQNAHNSEKAQLTANEDLRKLQADLEKRVDSRTTELQTANTKMKAQLQQINQLQDKLQEEAIRDPLTGLFNRRYLEETLVREIARARRENYDISFMLLDIDHFKQFNDLYGHDTGDAVLKALAEQLNSRVRTADIPCRVGGEEFLLVLPGILSEVAQLRAEYFRDQVQDMPIPYRDQILSLTVSVGVAAYPKNGESWEELYHAVDQALYRAKELGRNRVECA